MKRTTAFRSAIVITLIAAACGSRSSLKSGAGNTASLTFAVTGADFSGNSVQICGSRTPPADSKYFCNNSLNAADGACPCFDFNSDGTLRDPTTGEPVVEHDLCASSDLSADATVSAPADWNFTYTLFNAPGCTGTQLNDGSHNFTCFDVQNIATLANANASTETLIPGSNTNHIVCETVNAFKSFVFTGCNAVCNAPFLNPPGPPDAGCQQIRYECGCTINADGMCSCADGGITAAELPSTCSFSLPTCNILCGSVPDAGVPDATVPDAGIPDAAEDAPQEVGPVCGNPLAFPAAGGDLGTGFLVMVRQDAVLSSNEIEGALAVGHDVTIGRQQRVNYFSYNVGAPNPAIVPNLGTSKLPYTLNGQAISLVVGDIIIGPDGGPDGGLATIGSLTAQRGFARIASGFPPGGPWMLVDGLSTGGANPPTPATCMFAIGSSPTDCFSNPNTGANAGLGNPPRVHLPVQDAGDLMSDAGIDFDTLFATYELRSETLAECTNQNGSVQPLLTLVVNGQNTSLGPPPYTNPDLLDAGSSEVTINLEGGTTNVVNISSVALGNISKLNFVPPPASQPNTSVVINVFTVDGGFENWVPAANNWAPGVDGGGEQQAPFILYNFPDAKNIVQTTSPTFDGGFFPPIAGSVPTQVGETARCGDVDGTILAPLATLTDLCPGDAGGNVIVGNNVGNVIVENYIHGSYDGTLTGQQVHYSPFDGGVLCPCQ